MPSKRFKTDPPGQAREQTNVIYRLALGRPDGGYKSSNLFQRTTSTCPKCDGELFTRIRFGTRSVLGVVCSECSWLHVYPLKELLPKGSHQLPLFNAQPSYPSK